MLLAAYATFHNLEPTILTHIIRNRLEMENSPTRQLIDEKEDNKKKRN